MKAPKSLVEYENSLPRKIVFQRKCETPYDCHWTYKKYPWKGKPEEGIVDDDISLELILKYRLVPYKS
jgi:hypothetical protein